MRPFTSYFVAFDWAQTIRRIREERGEKYRDGVERAAALAVAPQITQEAVIQVMAEEFERFQIGRSRWDGSVA